MKDSQTPKTLLMLINKQWLVESITSLGSGYLIHLAYKNEFIDPTVLADIKNKLLISKVLGEIIFQEQNTSHKVAEVEVIEVNDFNTFIRFDLRLLEVNPFLRGKWINFQTGYLCYYKEHPA